MNGQVYTSLAIFVFASTAAITGNIGFDWSYGVEMISISGWRYDQLHEYLLKYGQLEKSISKHDELSTFHQIDGNESVKMVFLK